MTPQTMDRAIGARMQSKAGRSAWPSGRRVGGAAARSAWRLLVAMLVVVVGLLPIAGGATASTAVTSAGVGPSVGLLPSGWLHTSGARVVSANGTTVQVRAVNWFGLETANCSPHGLWSRSMGDVLDQIRSFGFNALRVPYANQCLDPAAKATSIDYGQNPSLVGRSPLGVLDSLVAEAGKRGLRIILDQHRPDTGGQSALWYTPQYPESRWMADWTMLARRYASDTTVIGADLHNEPHGAACWGCGDRARDWAAAATRAGDATLAANPHWLILVEGVETSKDGASSWWGGNLRDVAARPLRLATPDRVVYSPHDYPRSVFSQPWFSASTYPANLAAVWDRNWGYLARTGSAPVLLGEFGSRLTDTSDKQWMSVLVGYLRSAGISYAYWSFNPNSGDTGGLVKDDWRTPETAKLAALQPILRSVPLAPATPSVTALPPTPTPPAPPTTQTPPTTRAPTPTPVPRPLPAGLSVGWHLQSAWQSGYVAELTVADRAPRTGWSVSWRDASVTSVVNAWGMSCRPAAGTVTCVGADWARTLLPGQPQHVGLQVVSSGTAPVAPALTVG